MNIKDNCAKHIPGNFLGFLIGTNFAPIAKAIGGPKIKPLASTPALCHKYNHQIRHKLVT